MRRRLLRLALVALGLAVVAWMVVRLGPAEVLRTAREADPTWLGLSLLVLVARYLIWGHKFQRVLAGKAPVPYPVALRVLLSGSFANLTTPTAKLAGGFVRALLLRRRYGWTLSSSYGRTLADQITNPLGTLLLFGVLALVMFASHGGSMLLVAGSGSLTLVALAVAVRAPLWSRVRRPEMADRVTRWTPARLRISGDPATWIQEVAFPLLGERGVFFGFVMWGAIAYGCLGLSNAMVLRALGSDASLASIAAAVVLGYFAGAAVGAWGGIGVTEAALTAAFMRLGIPPETAAAGALLHRASFYLLVLTAGGLSLSFEGGRPALLASARAGQPQPYSANSTNTPV